MNQKLRVTAHALVLILIAIFPNVAQTNSNANNDAIVKNNDEIMRKALSANNSNSEPRPASQDPYMKFMPEPPSENSPSASREKYNEAIGA